MYYATADNRIGKSGTLPDGGIAITAERYRELIDAKANRKLVTVIDGEVVTYTRPVYSSDGTERNERNPDEPLITTPPPEPLHVPAWVDGEWTEAETAEQREAREAEEAAKIPGRIAAKRYEKETGGTTLNGIPLDTDRQSQALITGAALSATRNPNYTVRWKTRNGPVALDAEALGAAADAVRNHVQACFEREFELLDALADGTFTEDMLETGWPD